MKESSAGFEQIKSFIFNRQHGVQKVVRLLWGYILSNEIKKAITRMALLKK
jgi:hypothetical protein